MAKRYKYTVRKHDEAPGGTLSLVLAVLSFLFLAGSMITAASTMAREQSGWEHLA